MSLMKNKSVSFNVEVPIQKDALEWAENQPGYSFSEYVKAMIIHDMTVRKKQPIQAKSTVVSKDGNGPRS